MLQKPLGDVSNESIGGIVARQYGRAFCQPANVRKKQGYAPREWRHTRQSYHYGRRARAQKLKRTDGRPIVATVTAQDNALHVIDVFLSVRAHARSKVPRQYGVFVIPIARHVVQRSGTIRFLRWIYAHETIAQRSFPRAAVTHDTNVKCTVHTVMCDAHLFIYSLSQSSSVQSLSVASASSLVASVPEAMSVAIVPKLVSVSSSKSET